MSGKNLKVWALSVILGGLISFGAMTDSIAGVNIDIGTPNLNISIGTPPPVVIQSPPPMAVIPGTYVYVAPNVAVDILFYHGYWYRPYGGYWYRALSYAGPWVYLPSRSVPHVLITLPPGYRRLPPGYHPIPHAELQRNWERWERDRHWEHHH